MRNYIKIFSFSILALLVLSACEEQGLQSGDEVKNLEVGQYQDHHCGHIRKLFSIPSPIQTALLIKNSGASYSEAALHNPEMASEYQSKSAQAINLGIYGTTMAYSSLYDDGQTALQHYKALDKLSHKLGIGRRYRYQARAKVGSQCSECRFLDAAQWSVLPLGRFIPQGK
jgi:hypothetical protein